MRRGVVVYGGRACTSRVVTRVCNGILTISYVERGEITRLHVRQAIIIDGGEQPAHPLEPMIKENLVRAGACVLLPILSACEPFAGEIS